MSFFEDILPILKKHFVTLENKQQEVGDIFTFNFKFKENVTWKPGQHGLFAVHHTKIKKASRMFSIASAPSEGIIKISMRIPPNPSEFKQALKEMEPGQTLAMRGPVGSFYFTDQRPTLLIAGGIGITPMRALLKNYIGKRQLYPQPVQLLYSDSRGELLYREDLDALATQRDIAIKYLKTRESFTEEMNKYITEQGNKSSYFISGPKPMVFSIKETLKEQGINGKNIKHDPFLGY